MQISLVKYILLLETIIISWSNRNVFSKLKCNGTKYIPSIIISILNYYVIFSAPLWFHFFCVQILSSSTVFFQLPNILYKQQLSFTQGRHVHAAISSVSVQTLVILTKVLFGFTQSLQPDSRAVPWSGHDCFLLHLSGDTSLINPATLTLMIEKGRIVTNRKRHSFKQRRK